MSVNKKNKQKQCSAIGIACCALLLGLIGALSGFLLLASMPLQAFSSMIELQKFRDQTSKSRLLDATYFRDSVSRGRRWQQQREALLNGSTASVDLSAAELNAWMNATVRQSSTAPVKQGRLGGVVLPGVPNCFIDAKQGLYLNLPLQVAIYGIKFDYLIIARGQLVESSKSVFQLDALRVNAAVVPLPGDFGDWLVARCLQTYSASDGFIALQKAWQTVESIELVADRIRFKLR